MKWNKLYKYPKSTRSLVEGNRHYDVSNEILPSVTTRDSGYMAVKYEKMIPLLIEAIKEQQEQINELKEKLDAHITK